MENRKEQFEKFFNEKGLNQKKIAEILEVDEAHINKLINGKKPFGKKTARKWSDIFGLSFSWLLTGEGNMIETQDTPQLVPYFIYSDLLNKYEKVVRENEVLRLQLEQYENRGKKKVVNS